MNKAEKLKSEIKDIIKDCYDYSIEPKGFNEDYCAVLISELINGKNKELRKKYEEQVQINLDNYKTWERTQSRIEELEIGVEDYQSYLERMIKVCIGVTGLQIQKVVFQSCLDELKEMNLTQEKDE